MAKPAKKTTKTNYSWDDLLTINANERLVISLIKGGTTENLLDETIEAGKKLTARILVTGELK